MRKTVKPYPFLRAVIAKLPNGGDWPQGEACPFLMRWLPILACLRSQRMVASRILFSESEYHSWFCDSCESKR
jgi:hypothetical protein